jgi:hypothetical protein
MWCAWRIVHADFWASLGQSPDITGQFREMNTDEDYSDAEVGADQAYDNDDDAAFGAIPLPAESAADAANRVLSGHLPPPIVYHLRKPDVKHQARFPFVLGGFDTDVVTVDWSLCNAQNILDIFTCKMFGCGRGAQKTMGVWARELMKYFKSLPIEDPLKDRIDAVLKWPRSALQCEDFDLLLQTILAQAKHLLPTRVFLQRYSRQHVLHCVCKTFFPQITEIQVAQCRYFLLLLFFLLYLLTVYAESVL